MYDCNYKFPNEYYTKNISGIESFNFKSISHRVGLAFVVISRRFTILLVIILDEKYYFLLNCKFIDLKLFLYTILKPNKNFMCLKIFPWLKYQRNYTIFKPNKNLKCKIIFL